MVTSEKDAELALQVSNALTKALAQYKIKTFLKDVSKISLFVNFKTARSKIQTLKFRSNKKLCHSILSG